MAHIDLHPPGSFCWIELATTDQDTATRFYPSLFGWIVNDTPMGPGETYSLFQIDGRDVAAAYSMRAGQLSQGVPPHWLLYVSVADADVAVERAQQLGGTALMPAFDVMDYGRMAVLQDPAGAALAVWQPRTNIGIGVTGTDGTLCWADLSTPDRERVEPFYAGLFGWTFGKEDEDPSHAYWHIMNGEAFIGGMTPPAHRGPHTPPHWLAYFAVADCDATAAKGRELGATVFLPPTTFEDVGRMAVLANPQGAVFAIFKAKQHS